MDLLFVECQHLRIVDRRTNQHHPVVPIHQKSMKQRLLFRYPVQIKYITLWVDIKRCVEPLLTQKPFQRIERIRPHVINDRNAILFSPGLFHLFPLGKSLGTGTAFAVDVHNHPRPLHRGRTHAVSKTPVKQTLGQNNLEPIRDPTTRSISFSSALLQDEKRTSKLNANNIQRVIFYCNYSIPPFSNIITDSASSIRKTFGF